MLGWSDLVVRPLFFFRTNNQPTLLLNAAPGSLALRETKRQVLGEMSTSSTRGESETVKEETKEGKDLVSSKSTQDV